MQNGKKVTNRFTYALYKSSIINISSLPEDFQTKKLKCIFCGNPITYAKNKQGTENFMHIRRGSCLFTDRNYFNSLTRDMLSDGKLKKIGVGQNSYDIPVQIPIKDITFLSDKNISCDFYIKYKGKTIIFLVSHNSILPNDLIQQDYYVVKTKVNNFIGIVKPENMVKFYLDNNSSITLEHKSLPTTNNIKFTL